MTIESVMLLTISSSVTPFSSCLQSFQASGSSSMSQLFSSGGPSIRASATVFLMNNQIWFPLGLTSLILLLSKGLFSITTIQKHQFFSARPSLWSNSHYEEGLLKCHIFTSIYCIWTMGKCHDKWYFISQMWKLSTEGLSNFQCHISVKSGFYFIYFWSAG